MAKIIYYHFTRTETVFHALYWAGWCVCMGKSSYKSLSANKQNILNKISLDLPVNNFLLFIKTANIHIIQLLVTYYSNNNCRLLDK